MSEPLSRPENGESTRLPDSTDDFILFQITSRQVAMAVEWIRRALGWVTAGYVIGLMVFLIGMEWWGERFWLFSVLLYAPAQMTLLPLTILTPMCLAFRWRLVLWHIGAVLVLMFGYSNFRWSSIPAFKGSELKAVTFNYGESNHPQFFAFLDAEKPDIILMQDGSIGGAGLAKRFPGMTAIDMDQFGFLCKFPIQKAALVNSAMTGGRAVAVRYEIEVQGRSVAVYNVHMPTPRQQLSRFLGGRRVLGDLAGHAHRAPAFGDYRDWLQERLRVARALAKVFAEEKDPMIVGGDFNTPDHGYIYHMFAGEMTDAFTHAGRGWGLTFPGNTHNPISFFGPWLRIDYFFTGHGWQVTECRPEPGGKSQHKAVFARFEPQPMS